MGPWAFRWFTKYHDLLMSSCVNNKRNTLSRLPLPQNLNLRSSPTLSPITQTACQNDVIHFIPTNWTYTGMLQTLVGSTKTFGHFFLNFNVYLQCTKLVGMFLGELLGTIMRERVSGQVTVGRRHKDKQHARRECATNTSLLCQDMKVFKPHFPPFPHYLLSYPFPHYLHVLLFFCLSQYFYTSQNNGTIRFHMGLGVLLVLSSMGQEGQASVDWIG